MANNGRTTQTGGREATGGHIPGVLALSVGMPPAPARAGWQWIKLTDLARLETGHTPSRSHPEYWNGDIPWIGIRDATSNHGRTIFDTAQHTNALGIDNSSARLLPPQTVCLSRTASVGYVVVMGREMATSQDFVNWVCDPDKLDYRLLKYILLAERPSYSRFAHGTTHQTIYFPEVKAFHVCVPDIRVQQRIADVLGKLDDKIELNGRMNWTLEKMAAAIFKSWFIDFDPVRVKAEGDRSAGNLPPEVANLFPDTFEDSDLGPIPKGWTVTPIKHLADVNARCIKKDYPHARIRYVDISSVSQGSLDQTTTYDLADAPSRAKRLVQTGDTIWSCVRPNRKAYLYIDRPADNLVVSTGFAVLSPRLVPASYLHQWVTTQSFVDYLTAYATGAAYPAVKADTFETAKMLLPGNDILNAFHDLVGPLRARIAHNQRQNRRLAGLRDTLLPKLLSGEIELPEAEAVAEEVA